MPRPNQDRERVTLWVSSPAVRAIRDEAKQRAVSVSDMFREVLSIGWHHYRNGERRSGRKPG